jgi:hypothetical protein
MQERRPQPYFHWRFCSEDHQKSLALQQESADDAFDQQKARGREGALPAWLCGDRRK